MRKSNFRIGLMIVLLSLVVGLTVNMAHEVFASSLTNTKKTYVDRGMAPLTAYTLTLTMDSGGTDSHAMTLPVSGRVIAVKTNPGTTAPTDNYDLKLLSDGVDIMGGALQNRDTANTEWAIPLCGSLAYQPVLRSSTVTVFAENNIVANATVVLEVWVEGY